MSNWSTLAPLSAVLAVTTDKNVMIPSDSYVTLLLNVTEIAKTGRSTLVVCSTPVSRNVLFTRGIAKQ